VPIHCSSASRCKGLLSSLRSSSPATRLQARGVRFWPSLLGLDAARQPALTQLSYGRIVSYFVRQLVPIHCSSASRCKGLLSSLRSSSPATRLQARGVRFWPSLLGLDAARQPALTQPSYGRIVSCSRLKPLLHFYSWRSALTLRVNRRSPS